MAEYGKDALELARFHARLVSTIFMQKGRTPFGVRLIAVFMLPIFGALSDKVNTKYGKRTPFIFFGAIAAIIAFIGLTFIDNYQLSRVIAAGIPEIQQGAMTDVAFTEFVRQQAVELTMANPMPLVGFIATLLVVLISMATFRSPAVAYA